MKHIIRKKQHFLGARGIRLSIGTVLGLGPTFRCLLCLALSLSFGFLHPWLI